MNQTQTQRRQNDKIENTNLSKKDKGFNLIMENVKLYTDDSDGYAAYEIAGRKLTDKITSQNFKKYVRKITRDNNISINDNQLKEIISELDSEATFEGGKCRVFNRVGHTERGNILINPCYDSGLIIHVTPDGWESINPFGHKENIECKIYTPLMIKTKGMMSMPFPVCGHGNLYDLHKFLRTKDDNEKFLLIVAFIIQSFFYTMQFPIVVITAEPGSGKSFTTRMIKRIIDPHEAPILSVPHNAKDMFSTAGVSWLMAYDNFSKVPGWLSDLFCRFSTGGGTIDRELFTNGEAYVYSAKRPAIVNGINDFFAESDVLERAITFENKRIEPKERRPESELLQEFENLLPGIFFDLLGLLSDVLRILPNVEIDEPTRLADFCNIGTAAAIAMGFDEMAFMDAYKKNLKDANNIVLESSVIAPVIKKLIEKEKKFEGTPTKLLTALCSIDKEASEGTYWPKTPGVLSGMLKRLAGNLINTGIKVETGKNKEGERFINLYKIG